jgi:HAD superfamily hydrolase (TIGR01509 family)
MIKAFILDLDGTLVETEPLKNVAYAQVALALSSDSLKAEDVIAAATELIGVPAPETAMALVQRFGLEEAARARMSEYGAAAPWQAFSRMQLRAYNRLLDDPGVLHRVQLPDAVSLLHEVRQTGYKTALATMSYRREVQRLLDALGWRDVFDVVVTADDVERGKPDPEIYQRTAQELALQPAECLVIEDSPSGVAGALAAGMRCIAVPTSLTRQAVHAARLLDERWIVDDPAMLREVVEERVRGGG